MLLLPTSSSCSSIESWLQFYCFIANFLQSQLREFPKTNLSKTLSRMKNKRQKESRGSCFSCFFSANKLLFSVFVLFRPKTFLLLRRHGMSSCCSFSRLDVYKNMSCQINLFYRPQLMDSWFIYAAISATSSVNNLAKLNCWLTNVTLISIYS